MPAEAGGTHSERGFAMTKLVSAVIRAVLTFMSSSGSVNLAKAPLDAGGMGSPILFVILEYIS